jgi:hypothetical protein
LDGGLNQELVIRLALNLQMTTAKMVPLKQDQSVGLLTTILKLIAASVESLLLTLLLASARTLQIG